jgi:MFS family permease
MVTKVGPKVVMTLGMTLIGIGILWATQAPVHGHFGANLVGPFVVAGAGTAFSFIPISIAALTGVAGHQSGLASGLLNTSTQLGGAVGIAIASSVATTHTHALLHAGDAAPAALTGGFQQAFLVLGVIALLALPAIFALVRRNPVSRVADTATIRDNQAALAPAN